MARLRMILAALGAAALASSCGAGGTTEDADSETTTTAPAADERSVVEDTFTKFFSRGQAMAHRDLLEHGEELTEVIARHAAIDPTGPQATVQIKDVKISGDRATVTADWYVADALIGPAELLPPSVMVKRDGKWLVSAATYCSLIELAQQTNRIPNPVLCPPEYR